MTESSGQGFSGGDDGGSGTDFSGGGNPAWNDVLSVIPQELHSQVTPHFQKWDQNFQKVQTSYAPYKEFVDGGVPAEHIRVAMGLAQALDEQPEMVYQALHEQFGQQQMNGNGPDPNAGALGEDQGESGDGEFSQQLPPEFMQQYQAMQQQVDTMREILLQQKQERDQQTEDEELTNWYKGLSEQNPMFAELNKDGLAEPYMNSLVMAGLDEKAAMEQFSRFIDAVGSYHNRPKPPQIMGAGGFMPERNMRPRDMSDKQRKDAMVQMLRAAHHQD